MGALAAAGVGGVLGMVGQNQQNQENIGLQNAAENWMEHMSDTAHQREVADLKAAGLNPILSAGGGGASTPSAPPVSVGSPVTSGLAAAQSSASTALQMMKGFADINNVDSQRRLNDANTVVAQKNAGIKSAESDVMSDADKMYNSAKARLIDWYNRSGLGSSSSAFGNSLRESPSYMTTDQQRAQASSLNVQENP